MPASAAVREWTLVRNPQSSHGSGAAKPAYRTTSAPARTPRTATTGKASPLVPSPRRTTLDVDAQREERERDEEYPPEDADAQQRADDEAKRRGQERQPDDDESVATVVPSLAHEPARRTGDRHRDRQQ